MITIAPPAYVLFPFTDPSDGVYMVSMLQFPPLLAPPGFAPIGPPGSLAMPSVLVDTISLDLFSLVQSVSLLSSESLSPGQTPLIVQDTSAVCHTLSSSVPIAAVDSPVEPDQAGSLPQLATAVPDVGSVAEFGAVGRILLQCH